MKPTTMQNARSGVLLAALCAVLALLPAQAPAEDIDIFVTSGAAAATFDNPNVLIILDNTSNWARASQKWPADPDTGEAQKQGEAELRAIKAVISTLNDSINVGLMLFTDSGSGRSGGYIRFPVMQMTAANKTEFQNLVQYIYDNFNNPSEKVAASAAYSTVMFDAFKYFGGFTSPANVASGTAGTPQDATHFGPAVFNQRTDATLSDVRGYTNASRNTYSGPITTANSCARNFIIFIGNGFPNDDVSDMGPYLSGIGGNTTQLAVPGFTTTSVTASTDLGYTSACYTSQASCQTTDFSAQAGSYDSLSCSASSTTTLAACPSGQSRYQVLGNTTSSSSSTTTVTTTTSGPTAACYTSPPSGAGLTGSQFGMSCPSTSVVQVGNTVTTTTYACSYAIGATTTAGASCSAGSTTGPTAGAPTASTAPTNSCYASNASGDASSASAISGGADRGGLACPGTSVVTSGNTTTTTTYACSFADSGRTASGAACSTTPLSGPTAGTPVATQAWTNSCYANSGAANSGIAGGDTGGLTCPAATSSTDPTTGVVTTTSYSCSYSRVTGGGSTQQGSCASGVQQYRVERIVTPSVTTAQGTTRHAVTMTTTPSVTTVVTGTGGSRYAVTQTVVATATAVTTGTSSTVLGNTSACYSSPPTGTPTDFSCAGYSSCSFGGATSAAACPSGARYLVQGNSTTSQVVSNNTYAVPASSKLRMADEWARYLFQADANAVAGQQNVSTYTIDVFNAMQDADQTALLMSMARVGGGKYFAAKSKNAIISALKQIMSEIQAVNTVFASASLPVNATNRAQNENQVFIGMFRPDPGAQPRWMGNVKRYQLANFSGVIDLADVTGKQAVNLQTGFVSECATSWWTTDSGTYWQNITVNPPAQGKCSTSAFSPWSDSPDGPLVEKGAAAEVIRKGNNPPSTDGSPTWAPNRSIKTVVGSSLVDFTAASSSLTQALVDYVTGKDVDEENPNGLTTTETRPSLHGDVVHSRPLPVNYSTESNPTAGVTVFYGANDGTLRALNASNGKERWALIAPEFFPAFERLRSNSPIIKFPGQATGITPSPTPKNYFWDGSVGLYQNLDNSNVWIFPSMRRGGRMLYGLNVTSVDSPTLMWRLGCPNLTNDTGCSSPDGTDVSGIGQTWSLPSVAFIKGYSTTEPVIVVGGGYDGCEDANSSAPSCASPKGAKIYVIKASDGTVLKTFNTLRSVASDVAMVDVDHDGFVDYAYVGDTGGNFYRVDFYDITVTPDPNLAPANWAIRRVAYTTGTGSPVSSAPRKFFFPPALLYTGGRVYVAAGSGDREHPLWGDYARTDVLNRFYVFLDTLSVKPTTPSDADPAKRPVNLDDTTLMNNNTSPTTCTSEQILSTSPKKGWFMDLNQYGQGEQTVTSALILSGLVTFSTNRPFDPSGAGASCSARLGEARGYWVNLLNGSGGIGVGTTATCGGERSATFIGGGLPPSPVTGIVPVDGVSRTVVIGAVQRDGTASAPIGGQRVTPSIQAIRKRVYWFRNVDN